LPLARLNENLPTSISETYTSPVIFSDTDVRVLRFQVMQTIGNRENSHVFAMSEFQVHEAVIDEEKSPYYLKTNVKEAFDALQTELQAFRSLIVAGTVSAEARESLRQAIERAEAALQQGVGIEVIPASPYSRHDNVIYNLNGQKIENSRLSNGELPHGVYIVNGKKVLF
jgi:hypothetical protein